jgi:ribosomal protein S18 acetylase RimI-like enzyme
MNTALSPFEDRAHREQVIALWQTVFGDESAHNAPALVIDKKLAAHDGLFFVALLDGRVIGTVMAGYDGHRGWLYSVAVHPDHRQQGIGSQLVARAERALAERGCLKINLQILADNAAVAAFYASLGYAVEPRVSMGKRVADNLPAHAP